MIKSHARQSFAARNADLPSASGRRLRSGAGGALIILTAVGVVMGAGSLTGAQASARSPRTLSAMLTSGRLSPGAGTQGASSALCAPKLGHFNRTQACWESGGTLHIYINGRQVGEVLIILVQSIHLKVIGRGFTENLTVENVVPTGEVPPDIGMTLHVSCASPCHATSHFPAGSPLAVGTTGTISYHDSVGAGKVDYAFSRYRLKFSAPGFTSLRPFKWDTPIKYRCDDVLKGQGAGCVFPGFGSTLTTMAQLPDIARNIHRIQARGPGHYGRRGGKNPLHRLVDPVQQRRNHDVACARRITGPRPKGKSCDEYPFQSTYEGGHSLSKANRGWAWVPEAQQASQGGKVKAFYYANRVLDRDAFWVAA